MNNAYYFEINILLETEKSDLKNIFTNLYKSLFFFVSKGLDCFTHSVSGQQIQYKWLLPLP